MFENLFKRKDVTKTEEKPLQQDGFDPSGLDEELDESKIMVELQPQISLSDNTCIGAEALSRYVDENDMLIGPMMFLPILESASVVSELDYAVVKQVAARLKSWSDNNRKIIPIAINFSRVDFTERGFLEKVNSYFDENGIDKGYITIEVRESAISDNYEFMYKRLNWLHSKGYRIAVDDFGRENNIFFKLGDLPIDIIKFDRAVLSDATRTDKGKELISTMIEGFKKSGYKVVFENIETDAQREQMQKLGADIIQGFLYERPMPMDDFEEKYIS